MINNIVENEVFRHFKNGEFKTGEKILRKISFRLDNEDTETKRLVLYNLAWVQDEIGLAEPAKKNIAIIRNIIEKDEEYKSENIQKYQKVIGLYTELFKDEITVEEQIKINKEKYACCYDKPEFLSTTLVSKFDIYALQDNIKGMVDVIEEIHNNCLTEIYIDTKSKEENEMIRNQLKEVMKNSLKTLKEKSEQDYNEIREELFNSTNSSIVI